MIHGIVSALSLVTAIGLCVGFSLSAVWFVPLWAAGYVALGIGYVGVLFLISFLLPKEEHDSPRVRRLLIETIRWVLFLFGFRIRVTGQEKLPADGRFLLVGNHRSNYDPLITLAAFRHLPLVFVSKPENFRIPVAGPLMRNAAFLPIDRDNARNAVATIHRAADLIREGNLNVGIYPEGTRSKTGQLLPFRNGAFKIAKLAGNCPVAVMTVRYEKRRFFGKTVRLTVVDVLDSDTVAAGRTGDISDRVRALVEQDLNKTESAF